MTVKEYRKQIEQIPKVHRRANDLRATMEGISTELKQAILTTQEKCGCVIKTHHNQGESGMLLDFDLEGHKLNFRSMVKHGQIEIERIEHNRNGVSIVICTMIVNV